MSESLGDRIRKAREHYGMSQAELARRVKISKQALYQMESGKTEDPGVLKIKAIATTLRVNIAYLLGMSDDMTSEREPTALELIGV